MDTKIKQIIRNSYDLHFHIGPEIIPRKFDSLLDLEEKERGNIRGIALKNHFYPTAPQISQFKNKLKLEYIGGLVLNNFIGGLNAEAIYASSLILNKPIIVWFPTISAQNFLDNSKFEIPSEWVNKKSFITRKSSRIKPVELVDNKVINVLKMIKKTKSILATGHISANESINLVEKAIKLEVKKIIITHPIYQKIDMTINNQIYLANKGCLIEICYSMYAIDKIPITKIVYQIKKVCPKNIILSSDVGQKFSPSSTEALLIFSKLLIKEGVTLEMLNQMLVINTNKLVNR